MENRKAVAEKTLNLFRTEQNHPLLSHSEDLLQEAARRSDPWMRAVGLLARARAVSRITIDNDEAYSCLKEAYGILVERQERDLFYAFVALELGNQARVRGDYARARNLVDAGAEIIGSEPDNPWDLAYLRSHQGTLFGHTGRLAKAARALSEAAEVFSSIPGCELNASRAYNNLALAQANAYRYHQALEGYTKSYEIKQRLSPESPSTHYTLGNISTMLSRLCRHGEAIDAAAKSEQFWRGHDPGSWDHSIALHILGEACEACDQLEQAILAYRQGWDYMQVKAEEVVDGAAKIGFASTNFDTGLRLAACVALNGDPVAALQIAEEVRAFSLQAATTGEGLGEEEVSLLNLHAAASARQFGLLQKSEDHEAFAQAEAERLRIEAMLEKLVFRRTPVSLNTPDGWSFATWILGDFFTVCIWHGSDCDLRASRLPITRPALAKLLGSGVVPWLGPAGQERWDRWLASIEQELVPEGFWEAARDSEGIVFIPDGELWSIPFAALPSPTGPCGLVQPTVSPRSLTLVSDLKAVRASGEAAVAVGVRTGRPGWKELPFAVAEAEAVASQYACRRVLVDEQAAPDSVIEAASNAAVLHVAAHGDIDNERALASALLLGGSSRLDASAIMSATLPLELVVLSACSSARGSLMESEGFIGLAYAFHRAGAKRVLSSLWPVEDEETMIFMVDFHRRFAGGDTAAEALFQARKASAARQSLPTGWAAWTLSGLA